MSEKYMKCPECEINYIVQGREEVCATCKRNRAPINTGTRGVRNKGAYGSIKNDRKLRLGLEYGTNTREIYIEGCEVFGWNKRFVNEFGRQGALLYANNATPEGHAVWFLAHSNLTNSTAERWENWFETVETANDTIHEQHKDRMLMWQIRQDQAIHRRITFAKKSNASQYMFMGIYKVESIEDSFVKYKRVLKEY